MKQDKTTQQTPARFIGLKGLAANRNAMRDCIEAIPVADVKTILDIRYGLGSWAEAALKRFPGATLIGYESDRLTAVAAWRGEATVLRVEPFMVPYNAPPVDLLLADFNLTTVVARMLLDEAVEAVKPRYLVFTDVACVKLHMNYKVYGLEKADLDDYWKGFKIEGYDYVKHSRRQHAASTALYKRRNPGD